MTLSVSVWMVALALAAVAPWIVRAMAEHFESRVRVRTEALVSRARQRVPLAARAAQSEQAGEEG